MQRYPVILVPDALGLYISGSKYALSIKEWRNQAILILMRKDAHKKVVSLI